MLRIVKRAEQWLGLSAIFVAISFHSEAAEYFVAVDGADSNSGSQEQPFRTIQKAADMMKAGDTCYVRGGEYGMMVDPELAKTGVDWSGAVATLNVGTWQTWRRVVRTHKAGGDRFTYRRDLSRRLESKRKWASFDHYFLSGKLEALDIPTEWYLDRGAGRLYLWDLNGKSPAGHNVEAKVRDYVFEARER